MKTIYPKVYATVKRPTGWEVKFNDPKTGEMKFVILDTEKEAKTFAQKQTEKY